MRKTRHWLITIAALLCSMSMSAATYSDWTSTNKGQSSTTSSNTYTITANAGDVLTFDWLVSSESNYDKLIITIDGTEILSKSGELSGTYRYTCHFSSTYTMVVKYTKDGSVNKGDDYAKVYNITLGTGDTNDPENSGTDNVVASGTCGDNLTWKLTDEGELRIEGTGEMTSSPWRDNYRTHIEKVLISDGVTSISHVAFYDCSSLTTITIPENSQLTSIAGSAFQSCSNLTTINIPEGVTSIGAQAFQGCSSLATINIPEDSQLTSIEDATFSNCSSLTTIIIPEGVTSIGAYAFPNCSSLTVINIPESVTSIGEYAFQSCSSLATINIPENSQLTSIGEYAFQSCSSLATINIPENSQLTSIKNEAFSGTAWYNNQPDGVVYIGKILYKYKGSMPDNTSIEVKEGIVSIADYAFKSCSNLTSITFPESVTSIGRYAFSDCRGLTSITLPESVTSIGGYAFYYCSFLTSITVPEGVKNIGSYAFYNCSSLTTIILPESVTSIGNDAFRECSSLTSITLPESLTSISEFAFYNCSSLTTIILPESVTNIGQSAFRRCTSLKTFTISEGVTSIGWSAFSGCSSLTNVYCYAEKVPTTKTDAFNNSNIGNATLHVLANALNAYKNTAPWSSFGKFEILPPTSESITLNQYGSGTYCSEYALDFSEVEGLKAYAAAGYNSRTGVVTLLRVYTSQPGMGLFLKGEPGEYIVPTLESTDDNTLNMLVGTLEQTAINNMSSDGMYINYKYTIKSGETTPLFYPFADGSSLSAGKAYLQIPAAWLPAAEQKSISIRFDEGEGTTDIEDTEFVIQNSALIYDLMGRKVSAPKKGGVYIVNGKKVVY